MGSIDFKPKVESALRLIRESEDLSERDKELLQEFKRDLKIDGSSDAWVHKLLTHVRMMAERLGGADLEGAGKEDLKGVVEWVQGREDIAKATKRDYREALKRFYKWLNGGEHPERSRWINTTRKRRNRKLPEDLLSEGDVKELLRAAKNTRDRALIAVLWETGARIGELIDLKVGSFKERRHGKKILIKGKTGPRRLPLITSMPHVNDWLSNHPRRDDPEAPLWCKIKQRGMGERLSYQYVRKLLRGRVQTERIILTKPFSKRGQDP
ncbi:hypothetical protein AKJ37_04570 [candidate division MSBL1 archaeon SCGC-AAA259I09]|uniref:Tyr recombinase domain-containing protein n=1 Tax=candidate division MSBL1 archaeon SCGC-AAA259I09 TaxID=1698267 RepID=A0A133URG8_9EURY|nr:hypothetical protein AKJ37_04570 [candidate division MSBL1 archaeon SCGC-AAA259I09]